MASKKSTPDNTMLKKRIKELEEQVADYKQRLDDLRKAKSTTIIKKEREVLEMNAPQLGRRDGGGASTRLVELEGKLADLQLTKNKEIESLKTKVALSKATGGTGTAAAQQSGSGDPVRELECLRRRVQELEEDQSRLVCENLQLSERVDSLLTELSIKEAQWCETEEQLNLNLKTQWQEKYQDWMIQTEQKIAELQQANTLLRSCAQGEKPEDDAASS